MVQVPRNRYQYEKAVSLRKQGHAYNDIVQELGISKSTVSLWCRDIKLSAKHKKALIIRGRTGILQKLGALANKERRANEIVTIRTIAKIEIDDLDANALRVAGTMLYWAEGTKKKNTAITNSDPRIIQFMVSWLYKIFNIKPEQLIAYLHIHYQDDEKKIKKFWSQLTGIPLQNFRKSFIKPKGTGHRTNILPNGIINVRVSGIGTGNLRHRILAWSEKMYELATK